jgi:hypothetical protein
MLTLNQPPLTQHISIPKDLSQLSCEAFTAGIVEGVLDGLDVVRTALHLVLALIAFHLSQVAATDISSQPELPLTRSGRTSIPNGQ